MLFAYGAVGISPKTPEGGADGPSCPALYVEAA